MLWSNYTSPIKISSLLLQNCLLTNPLSLIHQDTKVYQVKEIKGMYSDC